MSNLYTAISNVETIVYEEGKQPVIITPGIENIFDNENIENIASAKKVISLLLNVLLTYKDGKDRTNGSQETWMDEEINSRYEIEPGLKYEFPLQALVALHVIQGFHDNNGWYQVTYVEPGEINFRRFSNEIGPFLQKAFEDDDTELSTL